MGYREAYQFISSLKRFGGGRGLEAIRKSLASIQTPQLSYPSIHIAGTNGKGSVSEILSSLLQESGRKVGLFTSPHLMKMNERIRIDKSEIDDAVFSESVRELSEIIRRDDLTFFEALTLVAFKIFHDHRVDIGVIEVGLGGRLDATNLVDSVLSIVTNIERDHTTYLGDDLESIAKEKLGIAKKGVPLLTGIEEDELRELFGQVCHEKDVPLHFLDDEVRYRVNGLDPEGTTFSYRSPDRTIDDLRVPLIGRHQVRNAILAIRSLDLLVPPVRLDDTALRHGLDSVNLEGRFQVIRESPFRVVLDVFHNRHGAEAALKTFLEMYPDDRLFLIIGMAGDKDLNGIVETFGPRVTEVVTVKPQFWPSDRDIGPGDLEPLFLEAGTNVFAARSMQQALRIVTSRMRDDDVLLVGGSFRTVAAAYSLLNDPGPCSQKSISN
jgi:dihydrofolate synthase/folylpolyglutamate synthase